MRKLSLVLAFVLALVMCVPAMAEETPVSFISIANPVIGVGEQAIDLSGIELQLGIAENETAALVIANLLSSGSSVETAFAQVDESKLAFYLDGMSGSYGVTVSDELKQAISAAMGFINKYSENLDPSALLPEFEISEGELVKRDFGSGEVDAMFMNLSVDLLPTIKGALTNPIMNALLNGTSASIDTDALANGVAMLEAGIYTAVDGSAIYSEGTFTIGAENATNKISFDFAKVGENVNGNINAYDPDGKEFATVTAKGTMSEAGDFNIEGEAVEHDAIDGTDETATFRVSYIQAVGEGVDSFDMTVNSDDMKLGFICACPTEGTTGDINLTFTYDEGEGEDKLDVTISPIDENTSNITLAIDAKSEGYAFQVAFKLGYAEDVIDASSYAITDYIDITSMDEATETTFDTEIQTVLMTIIGKLSATNTGIASMIQSLTQSVETTESAE